MRFSAVFKQDILFQLRHGFYPAYGIVCALYIIIFRFLPAAIRPDAVVLGIFTDTSVLGFFFVGGIILLERTQGIHSWINVSPVTVGEMVFSKILSLTCLAILASIILYAGSGCLPSVPLFSLAGIALNSVMFTLAGISLATMVKSINAFFMISIPISIVIVLPLMGYFGVLDPWFTLVLPSGGGLVLLSSGFRAVSHITRAASLLSCLVWSLVLFRITVQRMEVYMPSAEGGVK